MSDSTRLGIDLSPIWRPSVASDHTVAKGLLAGLASADTTDLRIVIAVDHHAPATLPSEFDEFEVVRFRGGPRMATNPTSLFRAYHRAGVAAGLYHHFGPWFRGHGTVTLVHDIVHVHDPEAFGPVEGRYMNLRKWSVKRSTLVLCPSDTTAGELLAYGYRPDRDGIDVVTWGAAPPVPEIAATPPATLTRPDRPFVLSVGRITERKRIPLAAAVSRECPSTDRLVIAGPLDDETIADELRSLPHVEVLGRVTNPELEWLYRNAQATLLTSRSEGFGLPIIEALQRGCPVLCTDLPAFREVGNGLDGVAYFDADEPAAVAQAAEQLTTLIATAKPDPDSVARRFSWTNTAGTVLDSLRRAALARR